MGDADAYPVAIKEILYRAASRAERPLTLIANQMLQVPSGFDLADHRIALEAEAGDVVVTTDIPLAALMVAKGATVVDPRGELLNMDNDRGSAVSEDKAIVINLIFWSLGIGPPLSMPARERAVTRPMGATGDRYPGNRREMSTFFVAL